MSNYRINFNLKKNLTIKIFLIFALFFFILCIFLMLKKEKYKYIYHESHAVYAQLFSNGDVLDNMAKYKKTSKEKLNNEAFYFNKTLKKNTAKPLITPTYDGSGQATHPDVLYSEDKIFGYKYWMAFTPYPFFNDKYENPSILVSNNGTDFEIPSGLKNPLADIDDKSTGGHLSDTDLMYDKNKFILHYVYNKRGVLGPSKFYRIDSSNGINWSKPELVYACPETKQGYSPAFIKEGENTQMWYFAGEEALVYTESKNNEKTWTRIKNCKLPMKTWKGWHLDIIKTDKGYEGLVCARNPKLESRALFYVKSKNGIEWKVSKHPIIFPTTKGWDNKDIYRATMVKDKDKYKIWYSACGKNRAWGIAQVEFTKEEIENIEMDAS